MFHNAKCSAWKWGLSCFFFSPSRSRLFFFHFFPIQAIKRNRIKRGREREQRRFGSQRQKTNAVFLSTSEPTWTELISPRRLVCHTNSSLWLVYTLVVWFFFSLAVASSFLSLSLLSFYRIFYTVLRTSCTSFDSDERASDAWKIIPVCPSSSFTCLFLSLSLRVLYLPLLLSFFFFLLLPTSFLARPG